jgi:tetratricopeptide (TPR) repeat protein
MTDQPLASKLAREAFEHWEAGRLHEAAGLYAEALTLASPEHYAIADYRGEYACVLEALGRPDDALAQLEAAAAAQRRLDGHDLALATTIARYFLADHLVRHQQPERALREIAPSLTATSQNEWLLRVVEVEAFSALQQLVQARLAAARALETAPSDAKRQDLTKRFAELGIHSGPAA